MRILNFHGPANNLSRSGRLHMLFFLGVPENFYKTHRKTSAPESQSQSLQPATLFKKELPRVFFREFSGIFKNKFSQRHLRAGAVCYFFCLGSGGKW